MAFCNSCGASLAPGTKFCSNCGSAVVTSSPNQPAASANPPVSATPAPTQGSNALKIILIVVGVVVLMGILGIASIGFFAMRVARHTHVRQHGDNVKVETPFGTVESTKDPQEAARNLGVDLYPGAEVLKEGTASATFAGVHSISVNLETSDSVDKVTSFYKSKFPNAMVTSSDANQSTIVANDRKNLITVNIKAEGDKTRILISNVSGKASSSSSSSN